MVAVILKLEKQADEVPINWKLGIDWTKINATTRAGEEILFADPDPIGVYESNQDAMCGGPVCTYRNKTLPCFVGTSPKASISSGVVQLQVGINHQIVTTVCLSSVLRPRFTHFVAQHIPPF
jgi:hypothetical protein